MSSIQTAIELSDRMSAPLYNICTAVNMVISNFEALEYASSTAIDTSSMEEARQLLADGMVYRTSQVPRRARAGNRRNTTRRYRLDHSIRMFS